MVAGLQPQVNWAFLLRLRGCLLTLPSSSWCDECGSRGPGGLPSPRVAPLRVKRRLSGDGRPANGASCWTGRLGSAVPRLRVRALHPAVALTPSLIFGLPPPISRAPVGASLAPIGATAVVEPNAHLGAVAPSGTNCTVPIAGSLCRQVLASRRGVPAGLEMFVTARNVCSVPIEEGERCHMCDAPASAEALHAAWCDECVAALVVRAGIASFGPPPGLTGRMRISMHAFEHAHRWLRFVRLLLPSQVSRTDALLAAGAPFSEYAVGCRLGPRIGPPLGAAS